MPQYFDPEPRAASRPRQVDLHLRDLGRTLTLATDRGVFSGDRIDTGTRLLVDHGPPVPTSGDLLDLGCGYGPLALALALRSPAARVWAVDVNERAVALCARNAESLGLAPGRFRACAPDEVPEGLRFAAVWSNPPIRVGGAALHELLLAWLGRLEEAGRATLVVQRHLGADSLAAWLGTQGFSVQRLTAKQGYRILGVGRP
jgi:16S rRNA (guanine1207-N2)-methyltransferase